MRRSLPGWREAGRGQVGRKCRRKLSSRPRQPRDNARGCTLRGLHRITVTRHSRSRSRRPHDTMQIFCYWSLSIYVACSVNVAAGENMLENTFKGFDGESREQLVSNIFAIFISFPSLTKFLKYLSSPGQITSVTSIYLI